MILHAIFFKKDFQRASTVVWMPQLQRPDKIIIAMYDLAGGTSKPLKYEDIVVKAFELYPQDFGLRGYPKFPDSSDIHKPLYGPLKRAGYVLTGSKQFMLTPKGVERGKLLSSEERGQSKITRQRLSRDKETEVNRIFQTEALQLFLTGKEDKILDTDLYSYLAVTVRTARNEFLGRLRTVEDAVTSAAEISEDPRAKAALGLHRFLMNKFAQVIQKMKTAK